VYSDNLITERTIFMKPGYTTTEFWLSFGAILVSIVLASDVLPEGHLALRIVGVIGSILGSMGYAVGRSLVKSSAIKQL